MDIKSEELGKTVGHCEECGSKVFEQNKIKGFSNLYQCPVCSHPNTIDELWQDIPPYIQVTESGKPVELCNYCEMQPRCPMSLTEEAKNGCVFQ